MFSELVKSFTSADGDGSNKYVCLKFNVNNRDRQLLFVKYFYGNLKKIPGTYFNFYALLLL